MRLWLWSDVQCKSVTETNCLYCVFGTKVKPWRNHVELLVVDCTLTHPVLKVQDMGLLSHTLHFRKTTMWFLSYVAPEMNFLDTLCTRMGRGGGWEWGWGG